MLFKNKWNINENSCTWNIELKKDKLFEIKQNFENAGHEFEVYAEKTSNEEILIQRAKDAEVIIVSNVPLGEFFIKSCT